MADKTSSTPVTRRYHRFGSKKLLVIVIIVLILVIGGMLLMWKPWHPRTSERTVNVTGETTITAEPDEFVFKPNYQFRGDNALEKATEKSQEIAQDVEALGVAQAKIKVNITGNEEYKSETEPLAHVYSLDVTIEVGNKDLADKVQVYLIKTNPLGTVSPQASFSENKRREIEHQARDLALNDARAKAVQNAQSLGGEIGDAKEISDSSGFGALASGTSGQYDQYGVPIQILPGENDLTFSIYVVFYVK